MPWRKTYDGAEPQRINKWLAQQGVCSRREAEALIADGLVSIDGARVDDPGRKIEAGQTLTLADKAQQTLSAALTLVLNKPVGFVSAQPEASQIPAARLLTAESFHSDGKRLPELVEGGAARLAKTSLAPLGRLDQDSRGLLLLSEDGVLAKAVIGPESELEKEYLVRVAGVITDRKLTLLRHGLTLDGRQLKPAKISIVADQQLRFILREGRNRQIRRMCDAVELDVTDLCRTRIGALALGDLPEGKWRPLTAAERAALISRRG